jgi:hypothetical protein
LITRRRGGAEKEVYPRGDAEARRKRVYPRGDAEARRKRFIHAETRRRGERGLSTRRCGDAEKEVYPRGDAETRRKRVYPRGDAEKDRFIPLNPIFLKLLQSFSIDPPG